MGYAKPAENLVGADGGLAEKGLSRLLKRVSSVPSSSPLKGKETRTRVTYDGEDAAAGALADRGADTLEVHGTAGKLRGWSEENTSC